MKRRGHPSILKVGIGTRSCELQWLCKPSKQTHVTELHRPKKKITLMFQSMSLTLPNSTLIGVQSFARSTSIQLGSRAPQEILAQNMLSSCKLCVCAAKETAAIASSFRDVLFRVGADGVNMPMVEKASSIVDSSVHAFL